MPALNLLRQLSIDQLEIVLAIAYAHQRMLSNPSQCVLPNVHAMHQRACSPSSDRDIGPRNSKEAVMDNPCRHSSNQKTDQDGGDNQGFPPNDPYKATQLTQQRNEARS